MPSDAFPKTIAHRGDSALAPENTMSAFSLAIDHNADGIELDLQLTKDQELVVLHDTRIDRTSNAKGKVSDYKLSELKKFDFGSWFSEEFENERIPTLEEVLVHFQNKNIKFIFDIKDINSVTLLNKLIKLSSKYLEYSQFEILSGYDFILKYAKTLDKNIFCRRGIFLFPYPIPLWISQEFKGPSSLNYYDAVNLDLIFSKKQIDYFHFFNKKVSAGVWNRLGKNLLSANGLDLIFTNNIRKMKTKNSNSSGC